MIFIKNITLGLTIWALSALASGEAFAASPELMIPKAVGDTVQLRVTTTQTPLGLEALELRLKTLCCGPETVL